MKCNCIQEIEEKIRRKELAYCASFEHLGNRSQIAFKPYTERGDVYKHFRYTSVPWEYCPFCGKQLLEEIK